MADANVTLTVSDPDRLIAGTSPYAPFVVAKIQLYRYASEANARANTSATLVTTFTLVASTTAVADPDIAGPYRWGYYDSSQTAASWYRYRFADTGLTEFSELSDPWEADATPAHALRDILFEVGQALGGKVKRGTASAGALSTVTCVGLFKSSLADSRMFEGWDLIVSTDAGGAAAAPENEAAHITSVVTSTGVATLERDLSVAPASGDVFLVSALLDFEEMIRVINRAREKMVFREVIDIALAAGEDRYPAPQGVRSTTDVLEAVGVRQYANSNREDEHEIDYRVVRQGGRFWLEFSDYPQNTPVARITMLRNYREAEGDLLLMADTTAADREWWRPVFAYAVAAELCSIDEAEPEYQRLKADWEREAATATARFAPDVQRAVRSGYGRRSLPGPEQI